MAYFASLGVRVRRVLTDNGPAFRSKLFRQACNELELKHSFTEAYRPQTNGKAERFIQSALREWPMALPTTTHRSARKCSLAHVHPDDRCSTVISGTHYIGYGDRFDETKLHAHTVGTFFTEPANTAHFGVTKDEGAILYFYGVGPSGNKPLH